MAERATIDIIIKAKDEASQAIQGINANIQNMSGQLRVAGIAMVAAGGAIAATLGLCSREAAEDEISVTRLSMAMRNMGLSYEDVQASLEEWIDTQTQKTAFSDEAQRASLATLIISTGDLAEAQDMLTLAMDISRGMGISLGEATNKVNMALAGNWGMLQRTIPALADCSTEEEKWILLQQAFMGQAEAYSGTIAGQAELLQNSMSELAETIGRLLSTALGPLIEKVTSIIQGVTEWMEQHPGLTQAIVIGTAALAALLIPLGTFLILLPMLSAGVAILTAVSSPWLLIIIAIIVVIAALVAIGVALYENWEKIVEWARSVKEWFERLGEAIGNFIRNVLDWLKARLEALIAPFKAIYDFIVKVIDKVKEFLGVAAEATAATFAPYAEEAMPIAAFQKGGIIPRTGMYYMHRGEFVAPAERTLISAPITIALDGRPIARYLLEVVGNRVRLQGGVYAD